MDKMGEDFRVWGKKEIALRFLHLEGEKYHDFKWLPAFFLPLFACF